MDRSRRTSGFSILEALLASALLSIVALGIISALVVSEEHQAQARMHTKAIFIAQEGLEAIRSLRDEVFSNLGVGVYGLNRESGTWVLTPDSDTTGGMYVRAILIESVDADTRQVTSSVSWNTDEGSGSVSLQTYLANWR